MGAARECAADPEAPLRRLHQESSEEGLELEFNKAHAVMAEPAHRRGAATRAHVPALLKGAYGSISEISDAENISKSYVSRILRVALLAPDIIEVILAGRADQSLMMEQLERPLPASWVEQRARILGPKTSLAV
jgi:hypothetical protein